MTGLVHSEHFLELAESSQELVVGKRTEKMSLADQHEVDVPHSHLSENLPSTFAFF